MEKKPDRRGAGNTAFYEPPACIKKTSAEIISEAKAAVKRVPSNHSISSSVGPQTSVPASVAVVRPVNTKRPYTPRESQRTLFGQSAGARLSRRPPSSFSLRYLQNQDLTDGLDGGVAGKKPALVTPSMGLFRGAPDPLRVPEELESMDEAPGTPIPDAESASDKNKVVPERKAYSSPREKTEQLCQPIDVFGPPVYAEESPNRDSILLGESFPGCGIDAILQDLVLLSGHSDNDAEVLILIQRLYAALRRNQQQTKQSNIDQIQEESQDSSTNQAKLSKKAKAHILRTLYRFVERQNDELLLAVARIVLLLKATGNNLAGACKLVFKVSRNDKNDALFMDGNILDLFMEALGRASPLEDAEACVYGYGALKFLTMNVVLLNNLLRLGALDLMVLHLKIVTASRAEGGRIPEQTSHAIFQLTGALRNVAGEERALPLLVSRGAITALCRTMELFAGDLDLITNIARTLSIVSTSEECCRALVEFPGCVHLMAKLLEKYPGRQDIVVRLGYALGNLLAQSDKARLLMLQAGGAMDSLLGILALYLEKDMHLASSQSNLRKNGPAVDRNIGSDGSIEDVIVKMIRIIANMCMDADVGYKLACNKTADGQQCQDNNREGEKILDVLIAVIQRKTMHDSGELVLSALSTLNNLSYYPSGNEPSVFQPRLEELTKGLVSFLNHNEVECLIETTKVLGNITRSRLARDVLVETGGLDQLVNFLESNSSELLSTTTGVLINIMADREKREAFRQTHGVERLVALLQRAEGDWSLTSLLCQVLWNFCVDVVDMDEWLGPTQTHALLETLIDYLDEERHFGEMGEPTESFQQWEEFAAIAADLVEKVEAVADKNTPSEEDKPWVNVQPIQNGGRNDLTTNSP